VEKREDQTKDFEKKFPLKVLIYMWGKKNFKLIITNVPAQKTCISVQNPFFSLRDGDFHLTPLGF
jgi:hypothetical protein